ncbi:hypothetical protein [Prochlorococcus marinus]|uniref:Protein family PM-1 n=1 Tax=Prochlorococcus marinus (strain MIT 9211) TaxID=93059 RepID=A9BDV2_PROM4|nr:hypothetical protein [Prochlorococcus marinus]ABX08262.1 Hypothetical protein P9211_03311 [Prochlorococcus marinus str. MIT 9211]
MPEPTREELHQSIEALKSYRNRLRKEITTISQKLHMPQKKIDSTLSNHAELKELDNTLQSLINQMDGSK